MRHQNELIADMACPPLDTAALLEIGRMPDGKREVLERPLDYHGDGLWCQQIKILAALGQSR